MEKEGATLLEVENNGEFLVLLDGRKLWVNPGDMPTVCIWIPTAELEISEDEDGGAFPVSVRNLEDDEEIQAAWV
jgi:predicted hotdog family 3-hydroxylacyl-ACP dehydratase